MAIDHGGRFLSIEVDITIHKNVSLVSTIYVLKKWHTMWPRSSLLNGPSVSPSLVCVFMPAGELAKGASTGMILF